MVHAPEQRVPPYDLRERTRLFANAVLKFCRTLPRTDEAREIARQLRKAANSTRANYRSSRKGRSRDEFQAKLQIACEEADEAVGWLEQLQDTRIKSDPVLLQEAREIASILTAAVKTARDNTSRIKRLPKS